MRNYEAAATATGVMLIARKRRLKHGEWLPWLAANFAGSQRTAYNYVEMGEAWMRENLQSAASFEPPAEPIAALPKPREPEIARTRDRPTTAATACPRRGDAGTYVR